MIKYILACSMLLVLPASAHYSQQWLLSHIKEKKYTRALNALEKKEVVFLQDHASMVLLRDTRTALFQALFSERLNYYDEDFLKNIELYEKVSYLLRKGPSLVAHIGIDSLHRLSPALLKISEITSTLAFYTALVWVVANSRWTSSDSGLSIVGLNPIGLHALSTKEILLLAVPVPLFRECANSFINPLVRTAFNKYVSGLDTVVSTVFGTYNEKTDALLKMLALLDAQA